MKKVPSLPVIIFTVIFYSCGSKGKYATTERIYEQKTKVFSNQYKSQPASNQLELINVPSKEWVATTNFGVRKPNYVILHHTAQNDVDHTIRTFHNEKVGASSHYIIGRDGKIVQMLNDLYRGHHAGVSKWGNDTDLNSSSIGIELDNNGIDDPWTVPQINALIQLLTYLKATYKIPQANFIGHMDVAPGRKVDPSRFPWKTLADQGFGYWYDAILQPVPADFNVQLALRIIGYNTSNLESAIKAFKSHFIQSEDTTSNLTESDKQILYNIYQKYL